MERSIEPKCEVFVVTVFFEKFPILFLVCISVVLPSGSIFGLNVKVMASVACALVVLHKFIVGGVSLKLIQGLFLFFSFMLFYLALAVVNQTPMPQVLTHAVAISSVFVLIFFPLFGLIEGIVSPREIIGVAIFSLILFSFFKLGIVVLVWFGYSPEFIKGILEMVFEVSFIGLDTGIFYRVHFPIDYLLPVAIYILMQNQSNYGKPGGGAVVIGVVFFFLAIVISYSRMLYAYAFLSFILVIFVSKVTRDRLFGFILFAGALSPYLLYKSTGLLRFVGDRYFGGFASSSDATRVDMSKALWDTFQLNPFLGRGLGGGVDGYVNIEKLPWYFELQWFSFMMQFGLVGFAFLFFVALIPAFLYVKKTPLRYFFGIFCLYAFWLLVGVFNGFMLTSAGGVIFLFFICLALQPAERGFVREKYSVFSRVA